MLVGCDFSSSPSKRKPIVVAIGSARQGRVQLQELLRFETLDAWALWLAQPIDWVGGFDCLLVCRGSWWRRSSGLLIGQRVCSTMPLCRAMRYASTSKIFAMPDLWVKNSHTAKPMDLRVRAHL